MAAEGAFGAPRVSRGWIDAAPVDAASRDPRGPDTIGVMPDREPMPFRRSQRPADVTAWQLRTPAFRRLFHDVYVDRARVLTPLLLAQAALLVAPDATVSHHSAARLWGGIVPDDGSVHLTCPGRRPQVEGITAHRGGAGRAVTRWRGVPVTTPTRTFLDLAAPPRPRRSRRAR